MLYDDKKFIGNIIKQARKKAGLNQAELCQKLGMTDKNLGNIENGRQFPQVNNFLRIIEVLNLKIEDFGVKVPKEESAQKNELFKSVLEASEKEAKIYLKMIKMANEIIEN